MPGPSGAYSRAPRFDAAVPTPSASSTSPSHLERLLFPFLALFASLLSSLSSTLEDTLVLLSNIYFALHPWSITTRLQASVHAAWSWIKGFGWTWSGRARARRRRERQRQRQRSQKEAASAKGSAIVLWGVSEQALPHSLALSLASLPASDHLPTPPRPRLLTLLRRALLLLFLPLVVFWRVTKLCYTACFVSDPRPYTVIVLLDSSKPLASHLAAASEKEKGKEEDDHPSFDLTALIAAWASRKAELEALLPGTTLTTGPSRQSKAARRLPRLLWSGLGTQPSTTTDGEAEKEMQARVVIRLSRAVAWALNIAAAVLLGTPRTMARGIGSKAQIGAVIPIVAALDEKDGLSDALRTMTAYCTSHDLALRGLVLVPSILDAVCDPVNLDGKSSIRSSRQGPLHALLVRLDMLKEALSLQSLFSASLWVFQYLNDAVHLLASEISQRMARLDTALTSLLLPPYINAGGGRAEHQPLEDSTDRVFRALAFARGAEREPLSDDPIRTRPREGSMTSASRSEVSCDDGYSAWSVRSESGSRERSASMGGGGQGGAVMDPAGVESGEAEGNVELSSLRLGYLGGEKPLIETRTAREVRLSMALVKGLAPLLQRDGGVVVPIMPIGGAGCGEGGWTSDPIEAGEEEEEDSDEEEEGRQKWRRRRRDLEKRFARRMGARTLEALWDSLAEVDEEGRSVSRICEIRVARPRPTLPPTSWLLVRFHEALSMALSPPAMILSSATATASSSRISSPRASQSGTPLSETPPGSSRTLSAVHARGFKKRLRHYPNPQPLLLNALESALIKRDVGQGGEEGRQGLSKRGRDSHRGNDVSWSLARGKETRIVGIGGRIWSAARD